MFLVAPYVIAFKMPFEAKRQVAKVMAGAGTLTPVNVTIRMNVMGMYPTAYTMGYLERWVFREKDYVPQHVLDDESVLDVSASAPQWSRLIPLEPALYMAKQEAVPSIQSSLIRQQTL